MANEQTGYISANAVRFSINRSDYALRVLVSVFIIGFALMARIYSNSSLLIPFAAFCLVWGSTNLWTLWRSPSFCITEDTLIVTMSNSPKNLSLPLGSLTCIASGLLLEQSARKRKILVSNSNHSVIIPPFLNKNNRKMLDILVERTNAQMEKTRAFQNRDLTNRKPAPPHALGDIFEKFKSLGLGERVLLFEGPVRKKSLTRQFSRKFFLASYMILVSLLLSTTTDIEKSVNSVPFISITLTFGFFYLLCFVSFFPYVKEWMMISPEGIAVIGKNRSGKLLWFEMKTLRCLKSFLYFFTLQRERKSSTGLALSIYTREIISIPIGDFYDIPLPCIQRLMVRYASDVGVTIKLKSPM